MPPTLPTGQPERPEQYAPRLAFQRNFNAVILLFASRPSSATMRISRACSSVRKLGAFADPAYRAICLRAAQATRTTSTWTPDFMPKEPPTSPGSTLDVGRRNAEIAVRHAVTQIER